MLRGRMGQLLSYVMTLTGLVLGKSGDFGQVQPTNVGLHLLPFQWNTESSVDRLAYKNSTHLPYPEEPISFRTFPDPRLTTGNHFKFVVSSCMIPNFPYMAFKGDRIKGFDLLSDYIWSSPVTPPITATEQPDPIAEASPKASVKDKVASNEGSASPAVTTIIDEAKSTSASLDTTTPAPVLLSDLSTVATEFMLLLGDFVYADIPSYGGDNVESYRRLYRRAYASPSFRKVYERLREFLMFGLQLNRAHGKTPSNFQHLR